jgi:diaminopimelate decarboxylase
VDLDKFRSNLKSIKDAYATLPNTLHAIAVKSNPLSFCLAIARDYGFGAEVASPSELQHALNLGFDAHKIIFDSPAKTRAEIKKALESGVCLNADNFQELARIDEIYSTLSPPSTSTIGVRVNPQLTGASIAETMTISPQSKFGISLEFKDELLACFRKYRWLTAVHCHVGSQGCALDLLVAGAAATVEFADWVNSQLGAKQVDTLDLGGGISVDYSADESTGRELTPLQYTTALLQLLPDLQAKYSLCTEYGRYPSAKAGSIVSNVEYTKSSGGRNIAIIHAGADLLLRTAYTNKFPHRLSCWDDSGAFMACDTEDGDNSNGDNSNGGNPNSTKWNVVGPLCFAGDVVASNISLPKALKPSDKIMIHDTGAYTLSMISRYNSRQAPNVFSVEGGETGVVVKLENEGERVEDVLRLWGKVEV